MASNCLVTLRHSNAKATHEDATGEEATRLNESNAEDPLKPEAISGRAVWSPCAKATTPLQKQLILLPPDES